MSIDNILTLYTKNHHYYNTHFAHLTVKPSKLCIKYKVLYESHPSELHVGVTQMPIRVENCKFDDDMICNRR